MEIGRSYIAFNAEAHSPSLTAGMIDITPSFVVPTNSLAGQATSMAVIAAATGVPAQNVITFGGTFVAGDDITVTVVSSATSRQLWRKSYYYTVQPGDALNDVATAIGNQIEADGLQSETPYTGAVAAPAVTIALKSDDTDSLNVTVYTNSAAGTLTPVATAATISEGQPSDLLDKGIPAEDILSATYDTYRFEYRPTVAQPFIDMEGKKSIEIYFFSATGGGGAAALKALIDAL